MTARKLAFSNREFHNLSLYSHSWSVPLRSLKSNSIQWTILHFIGVEETTTPLFPTWYWKGCYLCPRPVIFLYNSNGHLLQFCLPFTFRQAHTAVPSGSKQSDDSTLEKYFRRCSLIQSYLTSIPSLVNYFILFRWNWVQHLLTKLVASVVILMVWKMNLNLTVSKIMIFF